MLKLSDTGAMCGKTVPLREGQPTNATTSRMAFTMTAILRANPGFFMGLLPVPKTGGK
jgi:hypothetical protein